MATIDDSKVAFSTEWDIDQIVHQGETTVSLPTLGFPNTSTHALFTYPVAFTTELGGAPVVAGVYRSSNSSTWREFGTAYFLHTNSTQLYVRNVNWDNPAETIVVRWYVYNDKVVA